ncbi:hypothetical protein [Leucobacter chinensis]|uniref:hypothetical protein n=1 Tax=Leucobacter chinensis TaxID=2851010 RepID=UPI001C216ACA|nr:hypothetical protein [Leucobacter chinensis]
MTDAPTKQPRAGTKAGSVRALIAKVPTGWITGGVTAIFLAVTAAFGGLAPAPTPALATLEPGQEHVNDLLSMRLDRAVLMDSFPEAGAIAGESERVLALSIHAKNVWTSPIITTAEQSVSQALRLEKLGDQSPAAVARMDDATASPWLQPGVEAELVVTWVVPEDLFADGDTVEVVVSDATLFTGKAVTYGASWVDAKPAARVLLPATDVTLTGGAGDDE